MEHETLKLDPGVFLIHGFCPISFNAKETIVNVVSFIGGQGWRMKAICLGYRPIISSCSVYVKIAS